MPDDSLRTSVSKAREQRLRLRLAAVVCAASLAVPSTLASYVPTKPEQQAAGSDEKIDRDAYDHIRAAGLEHSHVMEYASALTDDIGPRLTGSPNMAEASLWSIKAFTDIGLSNVHREDWGEFGLGWKQNSTWIRIISPDSMVLEGQAIPWSPATNGTIKGDAVQIHFGELSDLSAWKGELAGKIILMGEMPQLPELFKPLSERYSESDLKGLEVEEDNCSSAPERQANRARFFKRLKMVKGLLDFLAEEKVAAVVMPSRAGKGGSGTGEIFDDLSYGATLGVHPYQPDERLRTPIVILQDESYGRIHRLLEAKVPVQIEMDVDTEFTSAHEHGFNTVAEISGTDPTLKDQVVMIGAHLDSWTAGTGATDNAVGSAVTIEVMRILNSIGMKPRRTIRAALWSGEEQGLFGSQGYVRRHFGTVPRTTDPEEVLLPAYQRKIIGAPQVLPEQQQITAYFNLDNGTGKIRGIYAQENKAVVPIFQQWIKPLSDLDVTTVSVNSTGETDHVSFDAVGIPAFQFIQDPLDYDTRARHSNMDTFERLQPEDMKQMAVVEAIFAWNAANREDLLPRKRLPPSLPGECTRAQ